MYEWVDVIQSFRKKEKKKKALGTTMPFYNLSLNYYAVKYLKGAPLASSNSHADKLRCPTQLSLPTLASVRFPFSSAGSLIAVTEYLTLRAQLSPFLSKTKQSSSSMYGSCYTIVEFSMSRNWLCVCTDVFKKGIDNTKPELSSFFRKKCHC